MATAIELHSEKYHAGHNPGFFLGGMNIGLKAVESAKKAGGISDQLDRLDVQQRANRESFALAMTPGVSYEQANAILYGARAAVSLAFEREFKGVPA